MITANQWYNIAQTAQVGTKSGIRIDFGTKYALFKVSVDYGNAVIAAVESNITAEETRLSVRIRYNNSAWFVDVRFSVSQETTLSAATYDNTGWEAVSPNTSVAGNTICIINDLTSLIRPSGGGESLFELMNVGTAEVPRFAVVPKKYNGVEVGIISNTFISMAGFEEPDDDTPVASSSLGDLLDVQITDPKSKDVLTYDEDLRKWVNGPGGLDETALGNYLTTNKYITQDALTGALNGYVTNEIYNTAITALNLRLTELETTFKEWFYYDDVNKAIRTKLSLIVDGTLSMGELGSGGGTEVASGKLADLLDVQITDPASGQILLYNEEKGLWVNGSAGLNEEQLEAYLKGKDYATNSALSSLQTSVNTLRTDFDNLNTLLNGNVGGIIDTWNEVVSFLDGYSQSDDLATILSGMNSDIANRVLIEDFEKLEGSVTDIAGYFTNGSANNALKLGGQLPSYYATADALNGVKNDLTSVSNRVKTFEDVIGIDSNGDVYIKGTRNFYTEGGTISMFGLGEGDSGEVASVSIKFEGSDVLYNPINGVITLPAYPSGGGVADSVDWANVTGKPTTLAGYGITDALSTSGGEIKNTAIGSLTINREAGGALSVITYKYSDSDLYGYLGFDAVNQPIWADANYNRYPLLHSGNYFEYAFPLSGGTINGFLAVSGGTISNVVTSTRRSVLYKNASTSADYGTHIVDVSDSGDAVLNLTYNNLYWKDYTVIHSGNIGSYKSGSADYISNSTYYYDGNFLTNDVSAYSLFGSIPTDNRMFPAFMENHPIWSGWADVAHFTGYCMYGATQFATEYNAINPRVAIRKYNQTRSDWGDWVEFITSANIGSQSVNYANSAGNAAKVAGLPVTSGNNQPWNSIPAITPGGFMDVGKHFEFHYDNTTGSDYSTVLSCTGNYGNAVFLPSSTGTLALLTDNVASATKLQTARTIFGQLFDGTQNVSGVLSDVNQITFDVNKAYGIFRGDWYSSSLTRDDLTFYAPRSIFSGNVLIGTTDDSGYKLSVNGNVKSYGNITTDGYLSVAGGAYVSGNQFVLSGAGNEQYINFESGGTPKNQIDAGLNHFYIYSYYGGWRNDISIHRPSGCICMGTSLYDTDKKLQVGGNIALTGYLYMTDSNGTYYPAIDKIGNTLLFGYGQSGAGYEVQYLGHTIRLYTGGGFATGKGISIFSDGSVTMGTHSQHTETLYVQGNVKFSAENSSKYVLINRTSGYDGGFVFQKDHSNIWQMKWADSNTITFYSYSAGKTVVSFSPSGDIVATGTIAMGTLSSSSDARLKDNIKLLTEDESLAVLRQLRPSKWNWKSNGALSYGFIAQEVESVASCMVDRMNDEELGQKLYLQYNQLHAFEVGAIQHIDSEVEQLKRNLNTANLRIKNLENELKQYRLCQ